MAQLIKRTTATGENRYDVRTRIAGRVVTRTFKRRKDADVYANTTEVDKLRGVVVDPRRARVTLKEYAGQWLAHRPDLAVRTRELYGWLLDRHILPTFGDMALADLSPSAVRAWHAALAVHRPTTAAKAYRLLSSILRTALTDEVIARNPCQVKGAAVEKAPERPVVSTAEVEALAEAMPEHLRVAVLLAAWCQLRRGELLGLRRRDIDILRGAVSIVVTRTTTMAGKTVEKEPKTDAGRRTVAIPGNILPVLEDHLAHYVAPEPDALVLPVTSRALGIGWDKARLCTGHLDLRLHDLRHSGLTWAAATGASVAELMHRGGHASPVAALRYQHATEDRDRALADALAELAPVARIHTRDRRAMKGSDNAPDAKPTGT